MKKTTNIVSRQSQGGSLRRNSIGIAGWLLFASLFVTRPASAQPKGSIVFSGGPGIIYAINANYDLIWYNHKGYADGTNTITAGKKVGAGWTFRIVFSGGQGVIYAINDQNQLLWYKHKGYADGTVSWDGPIVVGTGWTFPKVFSGGQGVIYAINANAELLWYRNDGFATGAATWTGPSKVGTGWRFGQVFSDEVGHIYAVDGTAQLRWYPYPHYADGTSQVQPATFVGTGWRFGQVFSGGSGVIYAIDNNGLFYWYKHTGYLTGASSWQVDHGTLIGMADALAVPARNPDGRPATVELINYGSGLAVYNVTDRWASLRVDDSGSVDVKSATDMMVVTTPRGMADLSWKLEGGTIYSQRPGAVARSCLATTDTANGTPVGRDSSCATQWSARKDGTIRPVSNLSRCLQIPDNSYALRLWDCDGTGSTLWSMRRLVSTPREVLVSGSYAYWSSDGALWMLAPGASDPKQVAPAYSPIALDGTKVWFIQAAPTEALSWVDGGGAVQTIYQNPNVALGAVSQILPAGDSVYLSFPAGSTTGVGRVPSSPSNGISTDVLDFPRPLQRMTLQGGQLLLTEAPLGSLWTYDPASQKLQNVAPTSQQVLMSGSYAYWNSDGVLWRLAPGASAPTQVGSASGAMGLDGTKVYFRDHIWGQLFSIDGGGDIQRISFTPNMGFESTAIAVAGANVYLADSYANYGKVISLPASPSSADATLVVNLLRPIKGLAVRGGQLLLTEAPFGNL